MTEDDEIRQFIEVEQAGKTWIYPFKLAEYVARVFDLKISHAERLVFEHVHRVIDGLTESK
jgi:hypothetical protein